MPFKQIRYFLALIGALLLFIGDMNASPFFADLDGGKISGAQVVAPSATPQLLGNEISPTGGAGAYTYQWESSVDEINWTQISGATASTYQPGAVTKTTYFRRKVISGNEYCYSNTVQVVLNNAAALNIPSATTVTPTATLEVIPAYTGVVPDNLRNATTYTLFKPIKSWYGKPADIAPKDYRQVTTYVDGIYRPIQRVSYKASLSANDLVDVTVYDQFGRQAVGHLPYIAPTDASNAGKFRQDAATRQPAFYKGLTGSQEDYFYTSSITESSSVSRIKQVNMPGKGFSGSKLGAKVEVRTNLGYDNVRIWEVGDDASSVPFSNAVYEKGTLSAEVSTNEQGAKAYRFVDREGKTIMTSAQTLGADKVGEGARTYFVYDGKRNLRYILSPLATKFCTVNNSWNFAASTTTLNTLRALCYKYVYDEKGRIVSSELPGTKAASSMVYDTRDRLVFFQDPAMKANAKGEWMVYFYDGLNREVMTAIYKNPAATRESLQALMNQAPATGQQTFNNPPVYDLTVTSGNPPQSSYVAGNSITFLPGFDSNGAQFTAEINPGAVVSEVITVNNPLPGISSYEPLTITYYDNYDWQGARSFSTAFQVNAGSDPYPQPVVAANNVAGKITGFKTKVLGRNQWLTTTSFYDQDGRAIQSQSENVTGGLDISTVQYNFAGNILSTHLITRYPQADQPETQVQLRYEYDNERNLSKVYHTIWNGTTPTTKLITENSYDQFGRLTRKKLADLEILAYRYNYLGKLKAINPAYIQDKSQPNYFGLELSYDNGFANKRMDGALSGVTWRRKGNPDELHAYGYAYDNTQSLIKADYTQSTGGSWSNGTVDYTVSGLEYDENGNIKKMKQNGMLLGNVKAGIDDLSYTYDNSNWSNQLLAVSDAAGDQQQGDFRNLANITTEYKYDSNGNMSEDENRGIIVTYNQLLDKPEKITLDNESGKSISFIYDALGNKLQKIVNEGSSVTTYTYINGFIYKNGKLLLLDHPAGRVRKNANGMLVYDYFITDHLGNTRTVLTEESNQLYYRASHEDNPQPAPAIPERDAFTFPKNVDVIPSTNKFYDYNGTNRKFVRLNSTNPDRKTGTAKVLKVMAGDKIEVGVQSYYANNSPSNNTSSDLPDQIVAQLINALLGPVSIIPNGKGNIVQSTTNGLILNKEDFAGFVSNTQSSNPPSQVPKAYLNYVLFDDNFKMVDGRAIRVSAPDVITPLAGQMDIKKSGYLYVYISNESPTDVYFDDLVVKHTTGPLLQEDSYYPFGLQMRGLSGMALNRLQNDYMYNGIEKISEFELDVYDAIFRNLDPQIGRWWQLDPLMADAVAFSPYNSNFNNPANLADPKGDYPIVDAALMLQAIQKGLGYILPAVEVTAKTLVKKGASEIGMRFVTNSYRALDALRAAQAVRTTQRFQRLAVDLQHVYGWTPPTYVDPGTIKQFTPNFADNWSESNNWFAKGSYEMSDGFWVTAQSLTPFVDNVKHINGSVANGKEKVEGFVSATNTVVSNYVTGQAIKVAVPLLGGLAGKGGGKVAVQFGKDANQIYHAFRHIDDLGLNRQTVQTAILEHFETVASQVVAGEPFNQVIQIGGYNIQYTAFKIGQDLFNIGRIHAIP